MCAALAATLGSCGLYTRYERPALEYEVSGISRSDSTVSPIAAMPWSEVFTDSCLQSWIGRGLERNTDLRIAMLRAEEAAATLRASQLALLPSVSAAADGSVGHKSPSRFSVGPSASWEVDIFGRQRNLRHGAEAAFYGAAATGQAVRTSIVAAIANSYYTLLMLDEQLSISERTLKTWDENIRVLQALKRAGRSNEAAVLQARANRLNVESSALTLRNRIVEQENAVRALLLDPEADLSRGTLAGQTFPDTLFSGITLTMLSNRPDVRAAEHGLQKCFYEINVARAAFYPSLKLSGNLGWTTTSGAGVGNPSEWIANAVGSLTAPLFSRGSNEANLKIAKAEYEIARLEFEQRLLDAGMEVNDALSSWQTAVERLILDKKQIVALKGAVHNTRLLMRNSPTNYLEVLTAQQRLLDAELSEANDRYEAIQSVIDLYHALGGGEL